MKNLFGNTNDLQLFGASGELRYCYWSDGKKTVETHYNEFGEIEKEITIKK
tara:strand:+ start:3754 stop:3906 length:153 start_codon:yes stop_codon:yes gene_type:complete